MNRGFWRFGGIAAAAIVFALPIAAALPLALRQGAAWTAWSSLADDPLAVPAWRLSVATAVGATMASTALAMVLVTHLHGTRAWTAMTRALGPMLAIPHAAFAIGLALLVMPAGVLARLLALPLGWTTPPDWPTVNDPHGVGLMLVLVGKEVPFLLWNLVALLTRPELALQLRGWLASGRTLGYAPAALWWRVLWPLLLPRLAWPLLAVLAYSLTVVDLALIVGPAAPPTLAVLAWQALQDGDPARNAEGAAMALALGLTLGLLVLAGATVARAAGHAWRLRALDGRRDHVARTAPGAAFAMVVGTTGVATYVAVAALLALSSIVGVWTFPALWPTSWSGAAWAQVSASGAALGLTAALGVMAAGTSLALVLLWFESTPAAWDERAMPIVAAPLVVPPLLLMVGVYALALRLRLDGTITGLAWVHTLAALPYVFVALAPAWRSFDERYETTALALGRTRAAFWWHVKRPLLAAPMAAALAVGFAVSVAQYLPTQFIGAGRHATVTTEAVTLASGGQRHAAAAFALLQALLPAAGFGLAAWVGHRQRRRIETHAEPERA